MCLHYYCFAMRAKRAGTYGLWTYGGPGSGAGGTEWNSLTVKKNRKTLVISCPLIDGPGVSLQLRQAPSILYVLRVTGGVSRCEAMLCRKSRPSLHVIVSAGRCTHMWGKRPTTGGAVNRDTHGRRSAPRDWLFPRGAAKTCLAHIHGKVHRVETIRFWVFHANKVFSRCLVFNVCMG